MFLVETLCSSDCLNGAGCVKERSPFSAVEGGGTLSSSETGIMCFLCGSRLRSNGCFSRTDYAIETVAITEIPAEFILNGEIMNPKCARMLLFASA